MKNIRNKSPPKLLLILWTFNKNQIILHWRITQMPNDNFEGFDPDNLTPVFEGITTGIVWED